MDRAGAFPNVNGGGMNFWADVAFTPSSVEQQYREGSSRFQLDRYGWIRYQCLDDHRAIQSPGHFGTAGHAGGAGGIRLPDRAGRRWLYRR